MIPKEINKCWFCPNMLEGYHITGEHVISSAIGGQKEVYEFICRSCNSTSGDKWDAELAKQFLWFSSAAGVKKGRGGEHPDIKLQTISGKKWKLRHDSRLVPDGPEIEVNNSKDVVKINISANNHKTIKNLLTKLTREYSDIDPETAILNAASINSYLDEPVQLPIKFGGPEGGKSIVKSCLALLSTIKEINADDCRIALNYLQNSDPNAKREFCIYLKDDLIVNRPTDKLFHCVSVIGQPQKRRILGYVELYNFAKFLININDNYDGDAFQETYAINPVSAKSTDLNINFELLQGSFEDHFSIPQNPPQSFYSALDNTMGLVLSFQQNRIRKLVISEAISAALKKVGLKKLTEIDSLNLWEMWLAHFQHNLQGYIASQQLDPQDLKDLFNFK